MTDIDISPMVLRKEDENDSDDIDYSEIDSEKESMKAQSIKDSIDLPDNSNVQIYISPHWTLEWCLFLSNALRTNFMDSVAKVHSKTKAFKKDANGLYNDENFKKELIKKLKERKLNKIAIAHELCESIRSSKELNISEDDNIYYLVKAIKHAVIGYEAN